MDCAKIVFLEAVELEEKGRFTAALELFDKRSKMGGSEQEVFVALLRCARLKERLRADSDEIIDAYLKAYHARPSRLEPLFYLAEYFKSETIYLMSYLISKYAFANLKEPESFYTEHWIYQYGISYQYAESAYHCNKRTEARDVFVKLLIVESLPESIRKNIESNLNLSVFS